MAVREDGAFAGSVSGGCVEGAVIGESASRSWRRESADLKFGVSNGGRVGRGSCLRRHD